MYVLQGFLAILYCTVCIIIHIKILLSNKRRFRIHRGGELIYVIFSFYVNALLIIASTIFSTYFSPPHKAGYKLPAEAYYVYIYVQVQVDTYVHQCTYMVEPPHRSMSLFYHPIDQAKENKDFSQDKLLETNKRWISVQSTVSTVCMYYIMYAVIFCMSILVQYCTWFWQW